MSSGTPASGRAEASVDDEGAPWTWCIVIVAMFGAMLCFLYWNAHRSPSRRWHSLKPSPTTRASLAPAVGGATGEGSGEAGSVEPGDTVAPDDGDSSRGRADARGQADRP